MVFRYERLQNLCFNCGIIGHEQNDCKKEKVMSVLVKETPLYDAKLSVAPSKSLATLAAEQGRWSKTKIQRDKAEDGGRGRKAEQNLLVGTNQAFSTLTT